MYFLRLGVVTSLLSETLISGFTTGAAIHVLTSQINGLLGLKGAPEDEPQFQVIHVRKNNNIRWLSKIVFIILICLQSYIDIFSNVQNLNWTAVIISSITIIILLINNEIIKVSDTFSNNSNYIAYIDKDPNNNFFYQKLQKTQCYIIRLFNCIYYWSDI